MIRPTVNLDMVCAFVVGAIDEQLTGAGFPHFAESNFLFALHCIALVPNDPGAAGIRAVWAYVVHGGRSTTLFRLSADNIEMLARNCEKELKIQHEEVEQQGNSARLNKL